MCPDRRRPSAGPGHEDSRLRFGDLGVFRRDPGSGDEKLVACGRLVSGLGDEEPRYRDMVERQVQAKSRQVDDPRLLENFKYPEHLHHPFDILDSFPGFHHYYRDLVKRRVTRRNQPHHCR